VSLPARDTGAHASPTARYQQQLARVLRVGANVAITLSLISPAASVFVIGPVAFGQQGSGTFLAFVIAALVSGCLALGWAELGALYPTASGLYGIVARVLGREAGFLSLVLQLATFVVGPSAFALAAGQYLAAVWPGVDARVAALVLLATAILLGVGGIRFNAVVVSLFLSLELGAILVVTVLGLANAHWSSVGGLLEPQVFAADGTATPAAPGTLLAGVAIGMLAYAGYGAAVVFSEETRGPRRGIARAVLLVLGIAVVAELVPITAALLGAPSLAKLATAPAPMSYLVSSLGGEGLARVLTLALVAAIFNVLLVSVLDFSRILYGSGRDRVWPAPVSRALAYVHPKAKTPAVATLTLGTAALALTAVSDQATAVTFTGLILVVSFALVALSALVSRLRQPRLARPYRMPLWPLPPMVALAGVAVTASLQTGRDLAIVAGILLVGTVYLVVYLRPRRVTHWILLEPPDGERNEVDAN
jgi:amino acid transporter